MMISTPKVWLLFAFSIFLAGATFRETSIFLEDTLGCIPGLKSCKTVAKAPDPRTDRLTTEILKYRRALAIRRNDPETRSNLSKALFSKSQQELQAAILNNDFESAERHIKEAIELDPNNMSLRLAQARLRTLAGKSLTELKLQLPNNDGERIAYAGNLMYLNKFDSANQQLAILINNTNEAQQILALADLCQMLKELDAAEAAYRKASGFPEKSGRAKHGLDEINRLREESKKEFAIARDFRRVGLFDAAIDQYRKSIESNPKNMRAHFELAETIQRHPVQSSDALREAANEYRAFLGLSHGLKDDERQRICHRSAYLDEEALMNDQRTVIAKSEDLLN